LFKVVNDVRDYLPQPANTDGVLEVLEPTKYIGAKFMFSGNSSTKKFKAGFIGFIALIEMSEWMISNKLCSLVAPPSIVDAAFLPETNALVCFYPKNGSDGKLCLEDCGQSMYWDSLEEGCVECPRYRKRSGTGCRSVYGTRSCSALDLETDPGGDGGAVGEEPKCICSEPTPE
jgi:hypothetical protein